MISKNIQLFKESNTSPGLFSLPLLNIIFSFLYFLFLSSLPSSPFWLMSDANGFTALQYACFCLYRDCEGTANLVGANPGITDRDGRSPLVYVRRPVRQEHPNHRKTIALLVQAQDAEKASLLVKVRRFVLATRMIPTDRVPGRVPGSKPACRVWRWPRWRLIRMTTRKTGRPQIPHHAGDSPWHGD